MHSSRDRSGVLAIALLGLLGLLSITSGCGSDTAARTTTTTDATGAASTIDIQVTDTAFDVSGPVRPGGTIRFDNTGDEAHYIQVRKVADDATLEEALKVVDDQEAIDQVAPEVGAPGNLIAPGHTVSITDPGMGAGDYVVIDFFPVEGDTDGRTHADAGMVGHFTVAGDQAEPAATDATFAFEAGQPVTGPTELTKGTRNLHLTMTGDDLVYPTLLRLEGDRTVEQSIDELNQAFGQESWAVGTGKTAATFFVVSAFPPVGDTMDLGVDLEPGTYVLLGLTYDDDGAAVVGPERITLTIS
jgi:hypothetical protein